MTRFNIIRRGFGRRAHRCRRLCAALIHVVEAKWRPMKKPMMIVVPSGLLLELLDVVVCVIADGIEKKYGSTVMFLIPAPARRGASDRRFVAKAKPTATRWKSLRCWSRSEERAHVQARDFFLPTSCSSARRTGDRNVRPVDA